MSYVFPRTQVEGLSLSRMIIGTNWMAGYSHTGPAADNMIKERHSDTTHLVPMFKTFHSKGTKVYTVKILPPTPVISYSVPIY